MNFFFTSRKIEEEIKTNKEKKKNFKINLHFGRSLLFLFEFLTLSYLLNQIFQT